MCRNANNVQWFREVKQAFATRALITRAIARNANAFYARINTRSSSTRACDARRVTALDDGEYDCVVTDVARDEDGVVVIDLAIATGAQKGNVIRLRSAMNDEPIHWLGLPGTLRVVDGAPSFRLEPA